MSKVPKYVLKNKKLNKTKTVLIFRRNFLNIDNFIKCEDGWKFEEDFNYHGVKGHFVMIVHSDNIFDMYGVNSKVTKVKGKKNSFGIFIRAGKSKLPFEINRICNKVEFILSCKGKALAFDNGKGIKATKEEKMYKQVASIHSGSRTPVTIPNSIVWSASHPFQGGSVTPR